MKDRDILTNNQIMPVSMDLLIDTKHNYKNKENVRFAEEKKLIINNIFSDFGINVEVTDYVTGPSITRYSISYNQNVSMKMISNVISDMQIRLGGISVRFESTSFGKSTSGLEIANPNRSIVFFKEVYKALPKANKNPLAVPLGKDVDGKVKWFNIDEAPHILISGTCGSGKSVFLNSLILSLIMRNSPDDLRLVLFDPKQVEFSRYQDMPHLYCPIIKRLDACRGFFQELEAEMNHRYERFYEKQCCNLKEYNEDAVNGGFNKLPYIIVIVDEYADIADYDLEVSKPIISLVQKARAAGIHIILSTQVPSTRFITGVLKANMPMHISFMSASMIDSITILGESGAEKLLGRGDMLVQSPIISPLGLTRYQGCYPDRNEIKAVISYLKEHFETRYIDIECPVVNNIAKDIDASQFDFATNDVEENKYQEIKKWAKEQEYVSISRIQRECAVGFNRAGRFFARLQAEGIVSTESEGNKGYRVVK